MNRYLIARNCRQGDRPTDLSNLGLLIKSWGRVLLVDAQTGSS